MGGAHTENDASRDAADEAEACCFAQPDDERSGPDGSFSGIFAELQRLDLAVYRAIEQTRTPAIDVPLRQASSMANQSKLWFAIAAFLFVFGGRSGRRAALTGSAAIGLNSFLVNLPLKAIARRPRPERTATDDLHERHLKMPTTRSFPSGHSASAFAFATAVSSFKPELGLGLRGLATVVAYSRIHCGVHYPGDVLVGSLIGTAVGESAAIAAKQIIKRRHSPPLAHAHPSDARP